MCSMASDVDSWGFPFPCLAWYLGRFESVVIKRGRYRIVAIVRSYGRPNALEILSFANIPCLLEPGFKSWDF